MDICVHPSCCISKCIIFLELSNMYFKLFDVASIFKLSLRKSTQRWITKLPLVVKFMLNFLNSLNIVNLFVGATHDICQCSCLITTESFIVYLIIHLCSLEDEVTASWIVLYHSVFHFMYLLQGLVRIVV